MNYFISNATIINEGGRFRGYVRTRDEYITQIGEGTAHPEAGETLIDAKGAYLLPGIIDDQVHFREPGLTHKATINSETQAAVAGGVTSFMEMPNTQPQTITQQLLREKFAKAKETSLINYSFYMGATNDNFKEVFQTNPSEVCGIKIFMGASTGNMLVDNEESLQRFFSGSHLLIATHCEDESIISRNKRNIEAICGPHPLPSCHPKIRSAEACYRSSSKAVNLAHKFDTQLHLLHLSTARETGLLEEHSLLEDKRITAEACIHHLWFTDNDYKQKGNQIKWNPAVKTADDREALRKAVKRNKIDVIATDHAPHTGVEKSRPYPDAPSGGPMVQHSLLAMLELSRENIFTPEEIVTKMAHAPAALYRIDKRGYLREGYYADMVIVEPEEKWTVNKDNLLYKCNWSPMEGQQFHHRVKHTFVNGNLVYSEGGIDTSHRGHKLLFNR